MWSCTKTYNLPFCSLFPIQCSRFGGNLVSKRLGAKKRRSLNPLIVLDYRCHVEGGKLGTNYPPVVTQCLRHLASFAPVDLRKKYG
jgi:hypothetical protein